MAVWASKRYHPQHFIYPVAEQNSASRRIAESLGSSLSGRREHTKYDCVVYHVPIIAVE
jgi:hypothetical protein